MKDIAEYESEYAWVEVRHQAKKDLVPVIRRDLAVSVRELELLLVVLLIAAVVLLL